MASHFKGITCILSIGVCTDLFNVVRADHDLCFNFINHIFIKEPIPTVMIVDKTAVVVQ